VLGRVIVGESVHTVYALKGQDRGQGLPFIPKCRKRLILSHEKLIPKPVQCRFQWPRGLRRESTAARLLGLLVRIPPEAWMSVSCECCMLSGRGLCVGLIPR
jgi:hypothetical protein